MKAPDKIYVQISHPCGEKYTEIIGFEDKSGKHDACYIRKDALMEWLEEMRDSYTEPYIYETYETVIAKLNLM